MSGGEIIISGNAHIVHAKGRDGGAGIGSGKGMDVSREKTGESGRLLATVKISGGNVDEAVSELLGAGIGGGSGSDAVIEISGGVIRLAQGGGGNDSALYQGAAGIGGGYQGSAQVTVSGDAHIVKSVGGNSAPGIGNGSSALEDNRTADCAIQTTDSYVKIDGGAIDLAAGGQYAAGIGSGNGAEYCNVTITGGTVNATGYPSTERELSGGAGIGSGVGREGGLRFGTDTSVKISITGGAVTSAGGWGAAGIGSGAANARADEISVSGDADIHAYSDGTKFALDTKSGSNKGTASDVSGRTLENVLQGTFVQLANDKFEGITATVTGMSGGEAVDERKVSLPEGYRSFAVSVEGLESGADNNYRVKAGGEIFAAAGGETEIPQFFDRSGHRLYVENGGFGDFFYLSPATVLSATTVWVESDGRKDKRKDVEISLVDHEGKVIANEVIPKEAEDGTTAIYRSFVTGTGAASVLSFPDPESQEELLIGDAVPIGAPTGGSGTSEVESQSGGTGASEVESQSGESGTSEMESQLGGSSTSEVEAPAGEAGNSGAASTEAAPAVEPETAEAAENQESSEDEEQTAPQGESDDAGRAAAANAASVVFDDLVKYDAQGDNAIEYSIEEAAIPQYRAAYVAGVNHMTITNTKETCYLRIVNVNNVDSDQKITGAQFRLEIKGENGEYAAFTGDEALEDGQFVVDSEEGYTVYDLVPGDYMLTEVAAPAGYKLMAEGITFTVNKDLSINAREVDAAIQDFGNMTIYIRNEEGSDIPFWKSREAVKFYVIGGVLLVALISLLIAASAMGKK